MERTTTNVFLTCVEEKETDRLIAHFLSLHCLKLVVNGRAAVGRVLRNCLLCRKKDAKLSQKLLTNLPSARLKIEKPR